VPTSIFTLISCIFFVGCRISSHSINEEHSTTATSVVQAFKKYPIPSNKRTDTTSKIVNSLGKSVTSSYWPKYASHESSRISKINFGRIYAKAIVASDGISRSQSHKILTEILSTDQPICGGTTCDRVIDLKAKEVDVFLDDLLIKTTSEPALKEVKNGSVRNLLIGSLKVDSPHLGSKASAQEAVADLYLSSTISWPQTPSNSPRIMSRTEVSKLIDSSVINLIQDYTGIDFDILRDVESYSDTDLMARGLSANEIAERRTQSAKIDNGIKKLPIFDGVVYRGVRDVPVEKLANWISKWRSGQPIGLGREDRPALASASWDPEVGKHYVNPWANARFGSNYGVMMVIDSHDGVSIESISKIKEEREILLPKNSMFTITKMVPVEGETRVVLMKLRKKIP
jgi:hypothetical protein